MTVEDEREYLAQLLEAAQRCAYFLAQSRGKLAWPLQGGELSARHKDAELFETLAAMNERFAKLQDVLAAAMRHAALLMGEQTDSFLGVLAFFEKLGIVASVEEWQQSRLLRNMAAHNYEISYDAIAEHFNALVGLSEMLLKTAERLTLRIEDDLGVKPKPGDFVTEFDRLFD